MKQTRHIRRSKYGKRFVAGSIKLSNYTPMEVRWAKNAINDIKMSIKDEETEEGKKEVLNNFYNFTSNDFAEMIMDIDYDQKLSEDGCNRAGRLAKKIWDIEKKRLVI